MKAILTRNPERVTVDLGAIPDHQADAMSRTLIGCIDRLFADPAVRADYERWKQARCSNKDYTPAAARAE